MRWIKLLVIVGSFTLGGCEYVIGKVYLDRTRAPIYLTENEQDITGCEFIKHVKSNSHWGGFLLQDEAQERVISNLTHESSEAGANVLLIRKKSKSIMGSTALGDAYRRQEIKFTPTKFLTPSSNNQTSVGSPEGQAASVSQPPQEDVVQKLKKLKELRDSGILTEKEYTEKRKELIDKL